IPQITMTARTGYCMRGAMEMCMAADIRIATENASFSMPEIELGIPSVLDYVLFQQHIGLSLAKEKLLIVNVVDVDRINQFGFLNKVVDANKLEAEVNKFLSNVEEHNRFSINQQKELLETWQNSTLEVAINDSVKQFALAFATQVPQTELNKFINK